MESVLPIFENANMRTLNYLAMPTSVVQTAQSFSYNYLFTKMISLYSKNRNLQLKDEKSILVPKCLPFPLWKALHFRISAFYPGKDIKKCIINSLSKGQYVFMCINEEFIPERYAFNKYYYYHEILVYGYNESLDVFYTLGYNDKKQYTTQLVSSSDILKAYQTNKSKTFSIYKIWLRKNFNFSKINTTLVKIKVFLYLNPIKKNYGIYSYNVYIQQLKKDFDAEKIDLRSFRTILDRACVFCNTPYISQLNNDKINQLISVNYSKAELLMLKAIKYSITKEEKLKKVIINGIKEIANNEKIIYQNLLKLT